MLADADITRPLLNSPLVRLLDVVPMLDAMLLDVVPLRVSCICDEVLDKVDKEVAAVAVVPTELVGKAP